MIVSVLYRQNINVAYMNILLVSNLCQTLKNDDDKTDFQ